MGGARVIRYDADARHLVIGGFGRAQLVDLRTGRVTPWDAGAEREPDRWVRWNREIRGARVGPGEMDGEQWFGRYNEDGSFTKLVRARRRAVSADPIEGPGERLAFATYGRARGVTVFGIFDGERAHVFDELKNPWDNPVFTSSGDAYVIAYLRTPDAPNVRWRSGPTNTEPLCLLRIESRTTGGPSVSPLRCGFNPEGLDFVMSPDFTQLAVLHVHTSRKDRGLNRRPMVDVEWIAIPSGETIRHVENLPMQPYAYFRLPNAASWLPPAPLIDREGRLIGANDDELVVLDDHRAVTWSTLLPGRIIHVSDDLPGSELLVVSSTDDRRYLHVSVVDVERVVAGPGEPLASSPQPAPPTIYRFWEHESPCPRGATLREGVALPGTVWSCVEPSGRRHGPYAWVVDGENPMAWGTFVHGRADGVWRWASRGRLLNEVHFDRGEFEGERRGWHSNGHLRERAMFSNGRLTGHRFVYHYNGALASEGIARNGRIVQSRTWTSEGRLAELTLNGDDGRFSITYGADGRRMERFDDGETRIYEGEELVEVWRWESSVVMRSGPPDRVPPSERSAPPASAWEPWAPVD